MQFSQDNENSFNTDIAIIGLSCRFPGANSVESFWNNLINGVESIKRFNDEELKLSGEDEELLTNPNYVKAKGILENIEWFDASFFGYNANDAKIADPQQRLFLECAWEALESSGYTAEKFKGLIAVYASMADSLYLQNNLLKNDNVLKTEDWFQLRIASSVATLGTQLSYRLNLKGPSINVATACSSSLTAIAMGCKALIDYDCDMAIAGAAAIAVPQIRGYLYQNDGIESPDGHCRSFDAQSKGTVFSNGVGVVVLKRLQDAKKDGDFIHAIIKGWNINNDGADKVGFSAPSVIGQSRCVISALNFANVEPESISYIETHGTGTAVGDPIEVRALTEAFRQSTDKKQFCAIGSVKTNIGHTDIASGMASFIKTVLALKNKSIPSTLHYHQPNPEIDFPNTPFYVNDQLRDWDFGNHPRRAGVNASGIGGTNAFLVLEENDESPLNSKSRGYQLLLLSAKTQTALEKLTENILASLKQLNDQNKLPDIAYTLQIGRSDFNYRRMLVCKDTQDALSTLEDRPAKKLFTKNYRPEFSSKLVFMFSGQGTQFNGMARSLYDSEPEFRKLIDACCNHLDENIKNEVCALLLEASKENLESNDTLIVQPALFILEYALAKFWMFLGIFPQAMIGHSLGEYVAACIAEVLSFEDALKLVSYRAQLMSKTSPGNMLAIYAEKNDLLNLLDGTRLSLAAINTTMSYVVSGEIHLIDDLERKCKKLRIPAKKLKTIQAFHSNLMNPILEEYHHYLQSVQFTPPQIPFISNLTGEWITEHEATDPSYWMKHLGNAVKFYDGLQILASDHYNIYLEVGPGQTLTNFVKETLKSNEVCIQNSLPGDKEKFHAQECFLSTLSKLWLYGLTINWENFYKYEKRTRIPLPTYPFERNYYWISPDDIEKTKVSTKKQPYDKWFYEISWVRSSFQSSNSTIKDALINKNCWIILLDDQGIGEQICDVLTTHDQLVIKIKCGTSFLQTDTNEYTLNYKEKADYCNLIKTIKNSTDLSFCIINLLALTSEHSIIDFDSAEIRETTYRSFYSSLFLTQALIDQQLDKTLNFSIVSNEIYSVIGHENVYPAKATATGPCRVIPQEHPEFKIQLIDLQLSDFDNLDQKVTICNQIIMDTLNLQKNDNENIIAYRQDFCWKQIFQPIELKTNYPVNFRSNGVYLLTGGLGGISLTLAKNIASTAKNVRLCLISRSNFLPENEWDRWLSSHSEKNSTSEKINKLLELQKLGAEIFLLKADVSDKEQLNSIIHDIKKRFNHINGVIHAAGIPGGGLVQLKSKEMVDKVFSPKIAGTYLLTHLLRHELLDFFVLCSSVSSVVGEPSQIDYCAANACLDAFAYANIFSNKNIIKSINWNSWREVGMAVETERPEDISYLDRGNDISPAEGERIFSDIINNDYKQTIVSTMDINAFANSMNNNQKELSPSDSELNTHVLEKRENYQPPSNPSEKKLITIWENILGIKGIGINDDFAALGGHSLMALRLLTRIEQEFKAKISLKVFQEANTIQKLAKVIASSTITSPDSSSIIIPIRTEGKNLPLWCLHPVGGNAFCYLDLAKYLISDIPVFGIQDPSIHKGQFIYSNLEDMASDYVRAIQKVQSTGPYLLSGLSFGGTLAVEIAQQLRAQGHEIKPLIFFDAWAKFSQQQQVEKVFSEAMRRLNQQGSYDKQFIEFSWKRMELLLNYTIPPIKEKIVLFKAETLLPEYREIDQVYNYWDYYGESGVEIYVIPGDHETILYEPNVIVLANKLNQVLAGLFSSEKIKYDKESIDDYSRK